MNGRPEGCQDRCAAGFPQEACCILRRPWRSPPISAPSPDPPRSLSRSEHPTAGHYPSFGPGEREPAPAPGPDEEAGPALGGRGLHYLGRLGTRPVVTRAAHRKVPMAARSTGRWASSAASNASGITVGRAHRRRSCGCVDRRRKGAYRTFRSMLRRQARCQAIRASVQRLRNGSWTRWRGRASSYSLPRRRATQDVSRPIQRTSSRVPTRAAKSPSASSMASWATADLVTSSSRPPRRHDAPACAGPLHAAA